METIFNGITITVKAANPKEAYAKLCEILDIGVQAGVLEYSTDTYTTDDVDTSDPDNDRSTADLFPSQEEE